MTVFTEAFAERIFVLAIEQRRAAELLETLFDGGSVTIDPKTDELLIATADDLWTPDMGSSRGGA